MTAALTVQSVSKQYGAVAAVDAVSLTIEAGRVTCLLGPSGCGKSTLLRLIAGLEPVDAGAIVSGGRTLSATGATVAPEARRVGLVFQDYALFPHLDVAANIGFGLADLPAAARRDRVAALLDHLQIAHRATAYPHTLSGGEQQRVAIARALAREPAVLLMDEPFSGLDAHLRGALRDSVFDMLRASGTAVLCVTHDADDAMRMADQLVLMAGGRVLQQGTPEHCYREPASVAAARLLGEANVIAGVAKDGVLSTPIGSFPSPAGATAVIVRPQHLRVGAGKANATILSSRFVGATFAVELDAAGQRLMMWTGQPRGAAGDAIAVEAPADMVRLLPA
ncbi:ABC transporter ATP-binding protein [Sphingoaurantiacus capsulatus]|uniref:ABC transporter ATP-binding protein n=1 Tax=Sphingoaurantiacus capsulatus TaxID=1771310 RepID=A0ABV7XCN6_9SPHN